MPVDNETITWPDFPITEAQKASILRKWEQDSQDLTYQEFVNTVQMTFHMDGAVAVKWSGMWLAIETDGYTHS